MKSLDFFTVVPNSSLVAPHSECNVSHSISPLPRHTFDVPILYIVISFGKVQISQLQLHAIVANVDLQMCI